MDFSEVIQARRSVRAFLAKEVDPQKLQAILEAIDRAPSAGNLQAFEVFLVRSRTCREMLVKASGNQEFILQAPLALVFYANPARSQERYAERGVNLYCIQDASIACCFAMLAAAAQGLGTVWVGAFNDQLVREATGVGSELIPVAILPIGYPAEEPRLRTRRGVKDLVKEID